MKKNRLRPTRSIPAIFAGLLIIYLLLLIPESESPAPPAGDKDPFIWNRDEYWSHLELMFQSARMLDTVRLSDSIRSGLAGIEALLDSCRDTLIEPSSPLLSRLEAEVFELAPLMAARPEHLTEFMQLHSQLREVIKDQSLQWDMNSPAARNRLYRLLYGTRTAVEEVMLQTEIDRLPALLKSTDEPSATPAAEIMGVTIHSGDILVSRGGAPTSALIARGSDYPGNFSHVALVHVDENNSRISIIESHIEEGVIISTIEEYLRDTKLRILVLRLRADNPAIKADPMLPHEAAAAAMRRVQNEHIPYDFEMDADDDTKLFCSEVASSAYLQFNVRLWKAISNISSPGVRSWLAAFGIKYFETQEPSDLEYDPQLRVVAEWRDPETLYKDHLDNAVIDVMLRGAETGERLEYVWYLLPIARLTKAYSGIKNLFGGTGPIPEGMSATAALKNDHFSKRHTLIKERLMLLAEDFHQSHGYRPPYWELVNLAKQAKEELRI